MNLCAMLCNSPKESYVVQQYPVSSNKHIIRPWNICKTLNFEKGKQVHGYNQIILISVEQDLN